MITYLFLESTKRCFIVRFRRWFNVDNLTLFRRWLSFQRWYKDFIYSSIMRHENKIVFSLNPKSTLFQRRILSMKQRSQIDLESTWMSRWRMSRRYFNIHQRWINVTCFLGCSTCTPSVFPFIGLKYILPKTSFKGFSWFCCICVYIFVNISYLVV